MTEPHTRTEPSWFNSATVKGTVAVVAGLFVLLTPTLSAFVLRFVLGAAFVVMGVSNLWLSVRHRKQAAGARAVAEAAVMTVFGLSFLLAPAATIRTLAWIGAAYLAVRGVTVLLGALQQQRRGEPWSISAVRGLVYGAVAAVLTVLSEGVVRGLIVVAAAAAVVVGAIILVYGSRRESEEELQDVDMASVSEMINHWLRERDVGSQRRQTIGDGLFFEEPHRVEKLASWWVMLLLSVAIATFGVIQDSTAVVIGAMLIAPLMTPILGTSAGIVNMWRGRVGASVALVLAGAGAAIGLAFIIGQWVPIIVPLGQNSQVISRVSPNLIDMLIALAAGAAGAYANVDDRVSDSIAGVAIAVALVPPLGVVGLTLQAGMFDDSLGALLLFTTNLVSIILAAALVFFLTGYAPFKRIQESREEIASFLRTVALAALIIVIPLSLTAEDVLAGTARQAIANQEVSDWVEGARLDPVRIVVSGTEVEVFLTGPGEVPDVGSLETNLSDGFGQPVQLTVEHAETTVVTAGGSG